MNDSKSISIKTAGEKKTNIRAFKAISPLIVSGLLTIGAASVLNASEKKPPKQESGVVQTVSVVAKKYSYNEITAEIEQNIKDENKKGKNKTKRYSFCRVL